MAFQKGHKKLGGRPKGGQNKRTGQVEEIASRIGVCPFEVLCLFVKGDWKALGYDSETRTCFTSAGIEYEEEIIKPEHRLTAAKEAVKYLFSQKKAVELSTDDESLGFRIVVEDYTKK